MSARVRAVLALAAVAAAVGVLVARAGSRYTVVAEFSDVRGLVSGAPVRLAGVSVGSVGRIWLGRDGWPHVALSLDDDVVLRHGASAAVRMSSLSSEWGDYVSVVQGDGPRLPPGVVIPRGQTASPVQVDAALSTFDPATRAELRSILGGLRRSLAGRGPALAAALASSGAALRQVAGLAGDVGDDGGSLALGLRSADTIASTLAARTRPLAAALDGTAGLLHTLAGRASSLTATLAGLPAALAQTSDLLGSAERVIPIAQRITAAAAPAVAELPATADAARRVLRVARPTLADAATVARQAPGAARAFTPVLRAAGTLLAVMDPVLRRLGPMLDQLRVRLPDAFSFFANWADFTANFDANGHGARVGIVLPPAPTNTLSPNSDGPGQLAPPYLRTPGALDGQPWTDYWKSFVDGGKR